MTTDPSAGDLPTVTSIPAAPQHVDLVYAQVRDAILRGLMKPGEEIRQERLARDLRVSRTPLREALRMLEREASSAGRRTGPTGSPGSRCPTSRSCTSCGCRSRPRRSG